MDIWGCDLVEVQALGKFDDNYKYILSVIDVLSEFLHLVLLRSKSGKAVASAFRSIFEDSRCPVRLRTHKGKPFLNKHFQKIIKRGVISFRCVGFPTLKVPSSKVRNERFKIGCTNISLMKIPTDISTFYRCLSGPKMTQFTRQRAWHRRE